ncbi:hypothetical protein GW17_00012475 [Ensete ventricosum]|nr:hypothetical protein GW17_00012475 [Ensete ventricosum]RZR87594.1 hypothetical protein BHM03_00015051 [Ensete ventricosum]
MSAAVHRIAAVHVAPRSTCSRHQTFWYLQRRPSMLRSCRDGQTPLSAATWADDGSEHYAMSARGRKPTCCALTVDCLRYEMTLMPSNQD